MRCVKNDSVKASVAPAVFFSGLKVYDSCTIVLFVSVWANVCVSKLIPV